MRSSMGACYIRNEFPRILSERNVLRYDIRAISTIRVAAADASFSGRWSFSDLNFFNLPRHYIWEGV